ncbi:MAG: hypothetical protein KDK36_03510 [Leptospiraceae bacterium]|nr:hypothetical protein [Leptospiraceae bacterium]
MLIEFPNTKDEINEKGFSIIDSIYTEQELNRIFLEIENQNIQNYNFRKSKDLIAIRQFLKEIPN